MANATATLTLCAMEQEEYAVAIDLARCHLKLFEGGAGAEASAGHDHSHSHGHAHAGAGEGGGGGEVKVRSSLLAMWVLRGRAFAALGETLSSPVLTVVCWGYCAGILVLCGIQRRGVLMYVHDWESVPSGLPISGPISTLAFATLYSTSI